ncbi:MAG: CDP-glycerol glycerophosphotransferase family protein [Treponema sp.]|jgi:CDP-glycerol glycerophosphotransferase|nr:CDP-glycerol glycerophosphotransferase family protein [Treponema sp.]
MSRISFLQGKIKGITVYWIMVTLYYVFRIFPIQKNKIFIQNFNGKGYGENPKYIAEEIIRRKLDYALVWAARPEYHDNFPRTIKTVPYKSIRAVYEEVTAKMWIDNCRKQLYVRKRKAQYYIHTWHGTVNLKKIEKDVEQQLSVYYVKQAKHDSSLINLLLSDSKFSSQLYRSAFWYNGEIFECGSPRDDILINQNNNIKDTVKKHFNIADNTKIILYAPTFRDNFSVDVYNINYELILNGLSEQTKAPWVFLIRLHPNISEKSEFFAYNDKILNASNYSDMQELLLTCDMLISDYSDCMYECALMNKPVFLYISDYEQYKKERDFYFDLFLLPFPCAMNSVELLEKMLHFDTKIYLRALEEFFQKVGILRDGTASEKVVDRITTELYLR